MIRETAMDNQERIEPNDDEPDKAAGGIRITTIYSNGKPATGELPDQLEQRGIRPEFNTSYGGAPLSPQPGGENPAGGAAGRSEDPLPGFGFLNSR